MFLRSGKVKKILFPPATSSPFLTPTGEYIAVQSVREQKIEQENRQMENKMAECVEALTQCCATTKGKVERIKMAILAAALDYNKFSLHALKLYLKTTDSAYDEFNTFQNRIHLAVPARKAEFEPGFIEFEELYEFVRIAVCEMLQKHEDDQKAIDEVAKLEREKQLLSLRAPSGAVAVNRGQAECSAVVPRMTPSLLLQQTPLPTFDGRYEHWHKFKAKFCDIVDKCAQDSPATKLHYLDKALVGEAKGAIDEQTLHDNNYQGAWKILIERYENLPMVIHGHITKLLNLKLMGKESSQDLRTLIDDCTKRVESLEFHKLKMDKMAEAIIITLLTSKLDPATRRSWELSVEHGKLPVNADSIAFLRKHCHVLERCEQSVASTNTKPTNPKSLATTIASKAHIVTVQKAEDGCPVCGTQELQRIVNWCGRLKGRGKIPVTYKSRKEKVKSFAKDRSIRAKKRFARARYF